MTAQPEGPDDPLLVACREMGRAMDLFDEAAAAALGVGRSDLRALNLLEHGPLGAAVLADRLRLTRASVTSLIDRLEAAGFVSRTPAPGDRRAVLVELRPATWRRFARVYLPLGQRVQATATQLAPDERAQVVAALRAMAVAFTDARDQVAGRDPARG